MSCCNIVTSLIKNKLHLFAWQKFTLSFTIHDTTFTAKIFRNVTPPAINNTLPPDTVAYTSWYLRSDIFHIISDVQRSFQHTSCSPKSLNNASWLICNIYKRTFLSINKWDKGSMCLMKILFIFLLHISFSFFFLIGRTKWLYSWNRKEDCVKRKISRGKLVYKLIRSHDYGQSGKVVF